MFNVSHFEDQIATGLKYIGPTIPQPIPLIPLVRIRQPPIRRTVWFGEAASLKVYSQ